MHPDGIFDDMLAFCSKPKLISVGAQRNDGVIQFRSRAAIQPNLLFARVPSQRQCREIDESQVDGFFQLVSPFPRQENPRDVRFQHPNLGH